MIFFEAKMALTEIFRSRKIEKPYVLLTIKKIGKKEVLQEQREIASGIWKIF